MSDTSTNLTRLPTMPSSPASKRNLRERMLEDLETQFEAALASARIGYFATARGQLNGAKLIIDEMERKA